MSEEIPPICYELLRFIHAHGQPIPYRELPTGLRGVGLLKVCEHRKLIQVVLWYKSSDPPIEHLPGGTVVIGASSAWLPYLQMGRCSVEDAIERDARCNDPEEWLSVRLTKDGDLAVEEWRLLQEQVHAAGGNRHPVAPSGDPLAEAWVRLTRSQQKAYQQRQYGQEQMAGIKPGGEGDEAAHTWLDLHGDEEGNKPVKIGTWRRYLRSARSALGEGESRLDRPPGGSIVNRRQI